MSTSPSVTPAIKLPRQVIRARERANELIRDRKKADDTPAPGEDPTPAPGVAADSTPAAPAQAPVANGEPQTPEGQSWHQRFKVVEGMFRKQRDDHQTATADLQTRIRDMEGEVARLKTAGGGETAVPLELSEFYTEEQIEALGEEQARINAAAAVKAAQKQVQAELERQLGPIKERDRREQESRDQQAINAYTDAITEAVPHWQDLDADPLFIAWLTHRDTASGMVRGTLLRQAAAARDPQPVIRLMLDFERENGAVAVPAAPAVVPTGNGAGSTGAGPSSVPVVQLPPTRAEIREHYKNLSTKRGYDGSKEAQAFEARIKAAHAAGQLR